MTLYPSHLQLPDGRLLPVTCAVRSGDLVRDQGTLYLVDGTCRDVKHGRATVYAYVLREAAVREMAGAVRPE